jgi:hypothetical protein
VGASSAWAQAPVNTTLWEETWTGGSANETPSAYGFEGTTVYGGEALTYAQSSTNTKLYSETLAGGTSPELLLSKSNQTWTINNIPTGQATEMSLTFLSNKTTFAVTSTTSGISISGSEKSWTITAESNVSNFDLTIKNTGSSNARIDNILLIVTTAGTSGGLEVSDFALTNAPVALSFDLYNNSSAQVISYTTSSTGEVSVSESDYVTTSVDEENKTITVTPKTSVTPSEQTITVSQAADDTYAEGSVTFTVTITDSTPIPTHNVTFSVNGETTKEEVEEGAAITFPENPADINDKIFMGWTESTISGTTNEAPTFVASATMADADVTYYAVFATKEVGGDDTYEKLTNQNFDTNAKYVIGAIQSASDNTMWYFCSYEEVDQNVNWGVMTMTPTTVSPIKFTLSGEASALVAKADDGNYLAGLSTGKFKMSSSSTTLTLRKDGTIGNSTNSYNLRHNYNGGSGGLRWYSSTTGTSAYFYKVIPGTIYSGYCTTVSTLPIPVIMLSAESIEMTWGDAGKTLTASAKIGENDYDGIITLTPSSENLTIDGEGKISCNVPGEYTITASIAETETYQAASKVCSVTVNKKNVVLSFPEAAYTVDLNDEFTAPVLTNESGIDVTYSSTDNSVAGFDNNGVLELKGEGETTIIASFAGNDLYNEAEASYTLTVANRLRPGSLTNPYTVAQAIDAIDNSGDVEDVYVSGIVCTGGSNLSSGALTYWISDDGTETNKFQVYKGKGIDGASFTSTSDVQVGDVVVVKGSITLYNSSIYEFEAGSQLVSLTRKDVPTLAFGQTSYTVKEGDDLTITASSEESDGAITYTSSNTEVAEINPVTGVVTAKTIGETTITATIAETATYKNNTAQVKLTVVDARDFVTEITAISPTTVFVGQSGTFTLTETQAGEATYSYSSSDASVLEISENIFVGKKNGEVEVTVTATPTDEVTYQPVTFVATVNVDYKYDAPAIENAEFSNSTSVTIPAIEGADVYYTLDGTTPTASSTKYTAAIELDVTTTIKAIAIDNDGCVSPVATATYTKVAAKKDAIDLTSGKTLIFNDFSGLGNYANNRTDYILADDGDTYRWTGSQYTQNGKELQLRAKGNSNGTGTITSSPVSSVRGFVLTIVDAGGSGVPAVYVGETEQENVSTTSGTYIYNIENTNTAFNIQESAGKALYIESITIAPIREATTLVFDEPVTEVMVGEKVTNTATASREGTITYRSSDETVATVDSESGEVTGVKIGTATITAFIAANADYNEASASYEITVNGIPAATIMGINISEVTVGDDDVLTATYTKAQDMESGVTVTMASSDEEVLSVVDVDGEYMYEAVKGGTATVTVTITPADVDHYTTVSREFEVTVLNEEKGTTELAIWDAEDEVESGSTVYGANVTLTALLATNYDGVVTATQTNDKIADVTITGENITIAPKAVGTTTITFTAPETANFEGSVAKTFALTVTAPEAKTVCEVVDAVVILNETFNGCDGTGGNDGEYSGNVAGKTIQYDGNSWTVTNTSGADKCIKVGTGSGGSATTPSLDLEADKTYTISFRVAGWSGDGTTLTLTASKGTLSQTSITMTSGAWTEHSVTLTGANGETTIKFQPTRRCFLDEVKVEIPAIVPAIPDVTIASSGYGSFCCEYPLDFSEANEDYKAWYVSKVEGATVTFTQITGTIAGGVPFFLYGTPGTYSLKVVSESTETLTGNLLRGTLAPTYVETVEGDYTNFALSKGAFAKMNTGTVKANKAFLPILTSSLPSNGAGARLTIVFATDEIVTDVVKSIRKDGDGDMRYYNLNGQRVDNPTKGGLYIVNGKKVVVK